jgi:FkbM family methyltransferase
MTITESYYGENLRGLIEFFKLNLKGVLHVGAHKCEEQVVYLDYLDKNNIYWVEAIDYLVKNNLESNPELNIINECVGDKDGKEITFNITNNTFSSSMLELGEHKVLAPHIEYVEFLNKKTKTLNTILKENNIENKFDLLVLDIQGAELLALKGLGNLLENFNFIYTEVNEKEIYIDCALLSEIDEYVGNFGFERKYLNILNGYGNALYIKKPIK